MYLGYLWIDPVYLAVALITLLVSIAAQVYISSTYRKWSEIRNSAGLTGAQVGQRIIGRTGLGHTWAPQVESVDTTEMRKLAALRDKGIVTEEEYQAKMRQIQGTGSGAAASGIRFQPTRGKLTDNYDPRSHTVNLSEGTATRHSVAAMAIVAHELGHAQQHENNSLLISMRNLLVPAMRFSPRLAFLCIFVGLLFNFTAIFWLGIIFYGIMVLFSLVTLPVEIDASRRGLRLLDETGLMQADTDRQGSRRVLTAAAATYLAAAVTAVLQLLYFLSVAGRRRR